MKKGIVTIDLDKYNAIYAALYSTQAEYDRTKLDFIDSQRRLSAVTKALIESKISDYTIKMYDYKEHDLYDICSAKYPISYTDYIALRDLGIEKETIVNIVIDRIAEIKERERNE